ncbi:MAG: hypothetical protein ACQR33_04635 [Candidatus Saccharibacteria bacterium]
MTLQTYIKFVKQSVQRLFSLTAVGVLAMLALAPVAASAAATSSTSPSSKPQIATQSTIHNSMTAPVASKAVTNGIHPLIAWTDTLTTSSNILWPMQSATLTATANQNVGPTPYYLSIYDQTAHSYVAICATGTVCTATVTQPQPTTHTYISYVSYYPSVNPPTGIQATSASVYVLWHGVSLSLVTTSNTTLPLNGVASFKATTSSDVGPSPFWIELYDATTGMRLSYCGFGTTCTATTTQAVATTHKIVAYVSSLSTTVPPANTIATSSPVYETWTAGNYRVSLSGPAGSYGSETITATANQNVGPTPYWIEIFDLDTNTRVAVCGSGTVCTATVALNNGINHYVAFISAYSSSVPPASTQAVSAVLQARLYIIG